MFAAPGLACTVSEIATDYIRKSIQRLAETLVADGLATYAPDPADGRWQSSTLTPKDSVLWPRWGPTSNSG
jgi:hypothetical protein